MASEALGSRADSLITILTAAYLLYCTYIHTYFLRRGNGDKLGANCLPNLAVLYISLPRVPYCQHKRRGQPEIQRTGQLDDNKQPTDGKESSMGVKNRSVRTQAFLLERFEWRIHAQGQNSDQFIADSVGDFTKATQRRPLRGPKTSFPAANPFNLIGKGQRPYYCLLFLYGIVTRSTYDCEQGFNLRLLNNGLCSKLYGVPPHRKTQRPSSASPHTYRLFSGIRKPSKFTKALGNKLSSAYEDVLLPKVIIPQSSRQPGQRQPFSIQ